MPYIVAVEELEGQWIAHVPDLPGCFSSHQGRETAINQVQGAIDQYITWCGKHGLRVSGVSGPMIVSEVIRAWNYEEGYEVNAFFASDRPPFMQEELPELDRLLAATLEDLLGTLSGLTKEDLDTELPGERWSLMGVLGHIAKAEIWYLDRLGLAPTASGLSTDPIEQVAEVRQHTRSKLADLQQRLGVVTMSGETWSPRKVLRRTLWHSRDHTEHLLKMRGKLL